ncbi:MAG: hypothetical protein KF819_07135 [Labilithrix sp.]|nr:hypothetical protein [Labilithrix sp.]
MSGARVGDPLSPAAPPSTNGAGDAARSRALESAAREFEAIFVRSLLEQSPIAGKGDAYGGMAVDAMATSVTAGRGLGLGELIRRTIEGAERRADAGHASKIDAKIDPGLKEGG